MNNTNNKSLDNQKDATVNKPANKSVEIIFTPDNTGNEVTLTDAKNNFIDTVCVISFLVLSKYTRLLQSEFNKTEIMETIKTEYNKYSSVKKRCGHCLHENYLNSTFLKFYLDISICKTYKLTPETINTDTSLQNHIDSLTIDLITNFVMYCLTHEKNTAITNDNIKSELLNGLRELLDTDIDTGKRALDIPSLTIYFDFITKYAVDGITHKIISLYSGNSQNLIDFQKNNTDQKLVNIISTKKDADSGEVSFKKSYSLKAQKFVFNNEFSTLYRSYKDGFLFAPFNPCTTFRDNHFFFKGKDFYNRYEPPYKQIIPESEFKYLKDVKRLFAIFNEMVRVVCNYDENYIKWFNDYIAQLVQRPYERMTCIPLIYTPVQQIGKSYIADVFLQNLLKYHTKISPKFENIIGNNNSVIARTVVQCKNEIKVFENGSNELAIALEPLKEFVSLDIAPICDKYEKRRERERVFAHVIISTNKQVALNCISKNEQRFVPILSVQDESGFVNDTGDITYKSYEEYKVYTTEFERTISSNGELQREFYQYCFNYYTQREIDIDFARNFNKYKFISETIKQIRNENITCKSDVVREALEIMHSDLIVDHKSSLPTHLDNDLQYVLKEIDKKNPCNNNNIQYYFNMITSKYCIVSEFSILTIYIRYVLENNPELYDNDTFTKSYRTRKEAKQDKGILGKYLTEFSACYSNVLKCAVNKRGKNTYQLNPEYFKLLNL